jgi:hypothetical protein
MPAVALGGRAKQKTEMKAVPTNSCGIAWQSTKGRLGWAASVLGWLSVAASLVLLMAVCILGVAEVGPYGLLLFALAPAIVVGRCLFWVAPHARAAAARFKPRFGLRTLLLTMAIGGLALGWVGNKMREVYQQRQITKQIYAGGFYSTFQDTMPPWVFRRFGMNGTLAYGGLDGVGNNESVRADDLAVLDGLPYHSLSLNVSDVTDEILLHLKPVPSLKRFDAQMTGLGDTALAHLAQFERLEAIDVRGTKVTDTGVANLRRLTRLKILILNNTSVTDGAVRHLQAMPQLRYLFLNGTAVTPQGAAELRRALPQCIVDDWSASGYAYPPDDW